MNMPRPHLAAAPLLALAALLLPLFLQDGPAPAPASGRVTTEERDALNSRAPVSVIEFRHA
ncbi:MAG: hypothetical protein P1V81_08950 [Planctomycetota bacterium]|nr:hypothetical protein [Planctomycetota bacterium]